MNVWYAITLIGGPEMWIALAGFLLVLYALFRKRIGKDKKGMIKRVLFVFIASVWLTCGLVFILKGAINIERPCVPCETGIEGCNPYCSGDSSFPSGHAAAIFAVFSSVYVSIRKRWFLPFFVIPFAVSVSRYFLIVHHMIDIVFGTVLGVFIPIIVLALYEKKP